MGFECCRATGEAQHSLCVVYVFMCHCNRSSIRPGGRNRRLQEVSISGRSVRQATCLLDYNRSHADQLTRTQTKKASKISTPLYQKLNTSLIQTNHLYTPVFRTTFGGFIVILRLVRTVSFCNQTRWGNTFPYEVVNYRLCTLLRKFHIVVTAPAGIGMSLDLQAYMWLR